MVQLLEVLLVALAVPVVLVAVVAFGVFILRKVRENRGAAAEVLVGIEVRRSFGNWLGDLFDDLNAPSARCSSDSDGYCAQETDSAQHTSQPDAGINAAD